MPIAIIYIASAMLLIAAAPLPYAYYMLLRLIVCGVFIYASIIAVDRSYKTLPWIYGLLAIIFNPIIKIHLPKEAWAIVDVATGIFLFITAKKIQQV